MPITTAEELTERALNLNLISQHQMQEVLGQFGSREVSLEDLRKVLLSRDFLTFYQIEHLIAEDRDSFFYGDNKILYLVGTGTFARVYRATNWITGEHVAIKVLRKTFSESKQEVQRFMREGKMGMKLKHPNIVPIYDTSSAGDVHYLVIEFVEGRNLRDFIKVRKKFEPLEASKLIRDICSGLDYAAGQGIFHRDMKMSNALVSVRGEAKLVDFGLAGADKEISDEMLIKNPNPRAIDYAGLERATGVHKNDARSDIYFVGCMYYHMLTGKSPLVATKDRTQRLSKGRYKDISPIKQIDPDLPGDVAAIVNKAIQFDPEKRYQTPGKMVEDLEKTMEALQAGADAGSTQGQAGSTDRSESQKPKLEGTDDYGNPRKVMIAEADVSMQDIFRERLKRYGYRVMLTSNPDFPLRRFEDELHAADVVVFSTGELQEDALQAFNEFGKNTKTKDAAAVLLLDSAHRQWESEAELADHRVVLTMPIKLRKIRETLITVINASKERRGS